MRNYWLRIAIGAAAIFTVGMIGVTLARQGVGRVRGVVEGSGPITLPIAFVPFKLDGRKLGSVNKVVLLRDAPKRISSVELEIKLTDSTVASGLAGCHLAANFEADHKPGGVRVNADPFSSGVFSCLDRDSVPQFQVFGRAVFQPGDVTVPLLLPDDIVNDLKKGDFGDQDQDSIAAAAEARADSISEAADARADSISDVAQAEADAIVARSERLVDSLRREGTRRADSARQAAGRMADSTPGR
jgi:cell division septum initiation protein DivIVA